MKWKNWFKLRDMTTIYFLRIRSGRACLAKHDDTIVQTKLMPMRVKITLLTESLVRINQQSLRNEEYNNNAHAYIPRTSQGISFRYASGRPTNWLCTEKSGHKYRVCGKSGALDYLMDLAPYGERVVLKHM
jgi:hypothetical protein